MLITQTGMLAVACQRHGAPGAQRLHDGDRTRRAAERRGPRAQGVVGLTGSAARGAQVRGKDIPKPVRSWNQCGLATRVLEILRKAGYDKPLPIQAQALPVIMSGRDCIGIAKTGSGKTLAFVLPMLRHIKDQARAPGAAQPYVTQPARHVEQPVCMLFRQQECLSIVQ